MIQDLFTNPIVFFFSLASLIIAVTIHEFAHAFAADRLGDPTPRLQGRLTLNPLAHLDPLGTLMLLFFRFGWGKPVEFDPFNLKNPRRDAAIISLAGPLSNIIVAIVSSFILRIILISTTPSLVFEILANFLVTIISMNIILCVFNLIPIHPLDGFKIVGGFLPHESARQWYELERYGFIFLILLLLPIAGGSSPMSQLIGPPIQFLLRLLLPQAPFV
ncbi:MAG: site-2 protease family protein [Patescibacteria group bacterium]|nr:site-2 protease family protein [Patescibacteria group bacterium]